VHQIGHSSGVLPPDAIHLEYSAPSGCPSEAEFAWQVRARIRQDAAPARKYAVVLTVEGPRARGTLRVEEQSRNTVREISGASCDEIAEGLALILALVIDPGARTDPARELPPPPPPERAPEPKCPPMPTPVRVVDEPRLRTPRSTGGFSIDAGASFVARSALASATAGAGDVFLEGGIDRPGSFSPRLRLAFEYAKSSPEVESAGTAQFSWMLGIVQACHVQEVLERRVAFPLCAGLEWGRVEASGSDTPDAQSQKQTWLALDADVGIRWFPWNSPIFVGVDAGLQVPLRRARFYFTPSTTVHTTPRVAPFVGLGAGVRLF
jgi:hypothetical protein